MKIILTAAAALGLGIATANAQTSSNTPAARPTDNDRGVTVDSSGAAVPQSSLDQPTPAPTASAPTGSYPATSDRAPSTAAGTRTTTRPPAIANPRNTMKTSAAPVPGKNSFTEVQALKRLEANGYSQISGLSKDKDSIWRAQAMKSGQQVHVALDYQGNIVETP